MTIFKISSILILTIISVVGCEKEKPEANHLTEIGDLVGIFELKYGDTKEITYEGEKITITIRDVKDSVLVDCSLVDFKDNPNGPSALRTYSYLEVKGLNSLVTVESKPCGALTYKNNGKDVEEIADFIKELKAAPANSHNLTYYPSAFIGLFGEGIQIETTSFKIFMAKAYPAKYAQSDANIDDYKFVFILTKIK